MLGSFNGEVDSGASFFALPDSCSFGMMPISFSSISISLSLMILSSWKMTIHISFIRYELEITTSQLSQLSHALYLTMRPHMPLTP